MICHNQSETCQHDIVLELPTGCYSTQCQMGWEVSTLEKHEMNIEFPQIVFDIAFIGPKQFVLVFL